MYKDFSMKDISVYSVPECHAQKYVMMDAGSGEILIAKDPFAPTWPASTTKVLTCLIALESFGDIEETIIFPLKEKKIGTVAGIGYGESIKVIDLLYGLMLPSGNDAAEAIAVILDGSVEKFAERMNTRSREIGCSEKSNFVNPHGIFDDKHMVTAYDMALISRKAMENDIFRKIVKTDVYCCKSDVSQYIWENTNALIHKNKAFYDRRYVYATGVKTGQNKRGYSLISAAEKNGIKLLQVYLNSSDDMGTNQGWVYRFADSRNMFEYTFEHYEQLKDKRIILA